MQLDQFGPEVVDVIMPDDLPGTGIASPVPVLGVKWYDERQGCKTALLYLAGELDGTPADYGQCYFYGAGRCSMNGRGKDPCLFHELETGTSWSKVKQNVLIELPDGSTAVCRRDYAVQIAGDLRGIIVGAVLVPVGGQS